MTLKVTDKELSEIAEASYSSDTMGYDYSGKGKGRRIKKPFIYDRRSWICYGASYGIANKEPLDPPNSYRDTMVVYCWKVVPLESFDGELANEHFSSLHAKMTDPDGLEWVVTEEVLEITYPGTRLVIYVATPVVKKKKNSNITMEKHEEPKPEPLQLKLGVDYESDTE